MSELLQKLIFLQLVIDADDAISFGYNPLERTSMSLFLLLFR